MNTEKSLNLDLHQNHSLQKDLIGYQWTNKVIHNLLRITSTKIAHVCRITP